MFLAAKNEEHLLALINQATQLGIHYRGFREPYYNDALCAVAFEPGDQARDLLRRLPLALSSRPPP